MPAGAGADASLTASSSATDLALAVGVDRVPTAALYAAIGARRVAGVGEYRTKVTLRPNGSVTIAPARLVGSTETQLGTALTVPGLTYAAGERILVRTQVTGASPTTVRARAWKSGTTEPTTWQVTGTDSAAGLQTAGSLGVNLYLSGSTTNGPVEVALDDLVARAP
jgi:hypothetical protein